MRAGNYWLFGVVGSSWKAVSTNSSNLWLSLQFGQNGFVFLFDDHINACLIASLFLLFPVPYTGDRAGTVSLNKAMRTEAERMLSLRIFLLPFFKIDGLLTFSLFLNASFCVSYTMPPNFTSFTLHCLLSSVLTDYWSRLSFSYCCIPLLEVVNEGLLFAMISMFYLLATEAYFWLLEFALARVAIFLAYWIGK